MLNWNKKKTGQAAFHLPDQGILKWNKDSDGNFWFGRIHSTISENLVELTIEVEEESEPSTEQLRLLKKFESQWSDTGEMLFQFMYECFKGSEWERALEELKEMYFLTAITLKRGNAEWWVVFEPAFDVPTIFNFFPRFTISEGKIIWSNLE